MKCLRTYVIIAALLAWNITLGISLVIAAKPANPGNGGGGGGGDAVVPTGVIYYHYRGELVSMEPDGTNKTTVAVPIYGIPSMATHGGTRWFLQGYFDLQVTNEANETITLYSPPEGIVFEQLRWYSHPLFGTDAFVSWREYTEGDAANGVLVRAPVIYGPNGKPTGLDLAAAEEFTVMSWDYDWSPDGTEIAYRIDDQLWVYDFLTGAPVLVPVRISNQPRWSPDGTHIAYGGISEDRRTTSIETINLNNLSITLVAKARNHGVNGKRVQRPVWSPDGKFIAYVHVDSSGFDWYEDIIRCTHDGKSPTNLTGDDTLSAILSVDLLGWTLK